MIYRNEHLRNISFPIGGIGTGSIGLRGNGRLADWEIFNRPAKGSVNGYTHFAIRCKNGDGSYHAKVLQGDYTDNYMGQYTKGRFNGFGFGPDSATMCGFPHFADCTFVGEFPIAEIQFQDDDFPAVVTMTAFNPFIPLNSKDSSIPAAFFELRVKNRSSEEKEFSTAFIIRNPFPKSKNMQRDRLLFLSHDIDPSELSYGDLTVGCLADDIFIQNYWYRGRWQDGIETYWNEFSGQKEWKARDYETAGTQDHATVMADFTLGPDEEKTVRYLLAWNVPNNHNDWSDRAGQDEGSRTWRNYYATIFRDSSEAAAYCLRNWDTLYSATLLFKNTLYGTTLDDKIMDRIAANLSVLNSPTVLRLEDGSFYGWEGVHELAGSCEGTCQHVWNYAYALCFLFPDLEQSILNLELKYSTDPNGKMSFRLMLPPGSPMSKFRACVDGQMGTILKIYRNWKITGNGNWIKENWNTIRKILEYAWSIHNPDEWDRNQDGVLEGRQHHTLDMELFGPSSWLEGFYLAALKAAGQMAEFVNDTEKAGEYRALFEKGYAWTKEHLFNGSYFIQKTDLHNKEYVEHFHCNEYWNEETKEIKYQIGEGSSIDQMCAQWHASLSGLGQIFDEEQEKTALRHMYEYNYKKSMRGFTNTWRIYSLEDEGGAIICAYPPSATRPKIPIPYNTETMTGFEYAFAGLLVAGGMVKEGTEIIHSLSDRFDGKKRNPWNEFECGSNYARSMASFALLPLFSGFTYDLPGKQIGFSPKTGTREYRTFWSLGTGWGYYLQNDHQVVIKVLYGHLELQQIDLAGSTLPAGVKIDKEPVDFSYHGHALCFRETIIRDGVEITYGK